MDEVAPRMLAVAAALVLAALAAPAAARAQDPVVVAVGDMACRPGLHRTRGICHDRAVARLAASLKPDALLALGDVQYERGALREFRRSYDTSFGVLKPVTRAVPGNHEYETPGARGYFRYFGARGRPGSFDLGAWHLVGLDSNCGRRGCAARAAGRVRARDVAWLRRDLAANAGRCTLAFWHHPLFSSGAVEQSSSPGVRPLWAALHDARADLVLNAHAHDYERFDPQDPRGRADPGRGLREFVVGTGGRSLLGFDRIRPNSAFRDTRHFGVLVLRLRPAAYDWAFVAESGRVLDFGTAACHAGPFGPASP